MDARDATIQELLNMSDSSDSGTSTLTLTLSSAESSPTCSTSVSIVCIDDEPASVSHPSQSGGSIDDLYFVPAKLHEITDSDGSSQNSNSSVEVIAQLPPAAVGLRLVAGCQEIACAYTPPKLGTNIGDDERTPKRMAKFGQFIQGVKKCCTTTRPSFRFRHPKPLVMSMKRRRSGMLRKTGVAKIIESAVKKEFIGFESTIQSIANTIKEQVLEAVRDQLKVSLDGFRDVIENELQKNKRSKGRSKVSIKAQKFAATEKNDEDEIMEPEAKALEGPTAAEGALGSLTNNNFQSSETGETNPGTSSPFPVGTITEPIIEETKTTSPSKRPTAFGALLKYVLSKTLLEKLTASVDKSTKDYENDTEYATATSSGSWTADDNVTSKDEASPSSQSPFCCINKTYSLANCTKQVPLSSEESFPETSNESSAVPTTSTSNSTTKVEPLFRLNQKQTKGKSLNGSCKALVPYVRTSSVPTKIIIGIPKTGAELVPKPEIAIRKYREALSCDYCGKNFCNNSSLKQHTSFHRPNRPYQCQHTNCNKAYKTRSELNRHLVVHSGEKNYECRQCGKRFLRKQYLKTHLLRHEEDLIWNCNLCSKIFVTQHDLDKHKVSYHKNGKRGPRGGEQPSEQLSLDLRA